MKQFVDSDYFLHHTKKVEEMKKWGIETVPVDLNASCVPTDKTAFNENFQNAQKCRDRKFVVGGGED